MCARKVGAGLNGLLRDPRYLDADDPEHKQVVDMVARAFEPVFVGNAGNPPGPARPGR